MLDGIQGVLLDLSGTLYSGDERIEGSRYCLKELTAKGIPYRFLTNTTTKSRASIRKKLSSLGIDVEEDSILTPLAAAQEQFQQDGFRTAKIFVKEEARGDLEEMEESEEPDVVIMGDLGNGFTYEVLNEAFRYLVGGAAFYALAKNRCFESGGEMFLDMGGFVEALTYASRKEAVCLGKPSPDFFARAVDALGVPKENVAVVGDDFESDVIGAMDFGMKGVLVKTGKYSEEVLEHGDRKPDATINSIRDFPELLS